MSNIQLQLNEKGRGAFLILDGNEKAAEMDISIHGQDVIVYHTEVFPKGEGQGLGKKLFTHLVSYAREHKLSIIPYCPFVHAMLKRHPEEYADLWRRTQKTIDHILEGREKSIGVETVLQPLPHKDFRFANPFVVLHHIGPEVFAPGSTAQRIPPHPHRGFAPVTFMFSGEGFHRDSQGNAGTIKAGEVQWMFAGSGLLHSEGATKEFLQQGGIYEFVQLWVNVPKAHKWDPPSYQQVNSAQMPALFTKEGAELKLVSGKYAEYTGPIQTFTPIVTAFGTIPSGKTIDLIATEGYWTLIYILSGTVTVNDKDEVAKHHLIVFSKKGQDISITAKEDTKLVYLSALPIDEPVAAKGNIVMNTAEEIAQAEADYAAGKFGELEG
ncbi:pirin family protein [Chitinophaga defluvii]|uniref:Pirin family protein n=1 Tax=Chitinophaga defluvii TaxID=3163343 RepID=A0ABV2TBP0_9BACT